MKNNRTTALLMLLVFLLVVAVVIIFLTGLERNPSSDNPYENVTVTVAPEEPQESSEPEAADTPAPTTAPTQAPTYYPPSTATPVQTAAPVSTAAPAVQTPTPTATPTPTPVSEGGMLPAEELVPVVPGVNNAPAGDEGAGAVNTIPTGTVIGSGTFRSDTGTALNIHADWSAAISGTQTVDITVTVYADHYSLITYATPGALQISVDGQYVSLASPAIENDGSAGAVTTEINSRTFTVSLASGEVRNVPVEVVWLYRGTYSGVDLETIECGGNITVSR